MEYGIIVGERIFIMFLILILGALCYVKGIITKDGTKQLSRIALTIVNPVLIFISYQADYDERLLNGLLWAFILSALSFVFSIIAAQFLIRSKNKNACSIERFSVIYSNCAFICIPLINSLYGSEGVLYLTAYLTFFNLLVWTHGLMLMKGEKDFSSFAKALKSPSVIAVIIGLVCYLLQLRLPEVPSQAMKYISDMNTPLAMLIAGATAAQTNIIKSLKDMKIYYISFLKLIFIPAAVFLIINLFPAPDTVKMTILVAAGCPAATMGTMFAVTLDKDPQKCSEIFTATTLLSCITLPLLVAGAGMLL
ncbi:AEC family transporter [Hominimerdicola sp. 21CYCFAH17_S]